MTESRKELQGILEKVYRERGFDFREYKETTLTRRLGWRLRARGAQTYANYARVLDQDPTEYNRLFNELTINVTSFFRDEGAFKALQEIALPELIKSPALSAVHPRQPAGSSDTEQSCEPGKGRRSAIGSHSLRIWSAGCATGEEPYSMAMLLLELLDRDIARWDVTILATDIDAKALQRAQEGIFTPKEVEAIRPAWLDRYFVAENQGFRVRPALRRLVTFETHNLVSDPPYQGLDLVVCRNVLIYFTSVLQMRVLKGFHKGLKERGFLLLGRAEVPAGETRTLFHCVDSKARLYGKASQPIADGGSPVADGRAASGKQTSRLNKLSVGNPAEIRQPKSAIQRVVVVGASAGGIDALTRVLSCLPASLPATLLVVQHLKADRRTYLPEHLARYSSLRVCLAQDRMILEAGVVYVAVPGQHLRVDNERLFLDLAEPVHYVRPSVDVLFTSAAQAFGPKVIGVVLSGTGRDGACGCQEIKANGGITIAQDEQSSLYFVMPRAAIDAGAIDYVLPPGEIAGKIVALTTAQGVSHV